MSLRRDQTARGSAAAEPIWLLSTRGRPRECQETLDACREAGMTSPGVVYVDETVDEYRKIKLPKNWTIHYEPRWGSLQASMSWCFANYPNATSYGWLADDVRPRSPGWDKTLEFWAGEWCLSYANDDWLSRAGRTLAELEDGANLSSGLCWGGNLVREVGWWALPGVRQAWIDVAWCQIIQPLNLYRYLHDVTVEHLNYRTGKRERDAVDDWAREGDDYIERDIKIGESWCGSPAHMEILKRLRKKVDVRPTERQVQQALQRSRDHYATLMWKPGMSGARLENILAEYDRSGRSAELAQILTADPDKGSS